MTHLISLLGKNRLTILKDDEQLYRQIVPDCFGDVGRHGFAVNFRHGEGHRFLPITTSILTNTAYLLYVRW
jgi:hypothetical protein